MPEYSYILVFVFVLSLVLHKRNHLTIYGSPLRALVIHGILFIAGVAWDQYAIWRGHWSFGNQFLLGPRIGYMPVEEYAFAVIVPYFAFVMYKLTEKMVKK